MLILHIKQEIRPKNKYLFNVKKKFPMNKNKQDLQEIKKGNTGYGLLIENDGYISADLTQHNKQLKESFDNNDEWYVPKPFLVQAVFQKFGIKNANGRIYPEAILKREVEKYQQRIKEHRAYGECYKPDAKILTESGWKTLEEVKEGENILTLNTDTGVIEIKPIIRKIEMDYDGELIHIHNRNINDEVTPNHEYILNDRNGKYWGRAKAIDIFNKAVPSQNKKYIPRRGEWIGRNDEYFIIPNLSDERIEKMHSYNQEKYNSDLKIPMSIFAKFMGIYLSEGTCDKTEDGYRVSIYQRKEETTSEIEEMLNEWGIKYSKETRISAEDGKETYVFLICDMRLCKYLQQFGLCYDKFVPFELKQQNKETLKLFYDWFVKGDGRIRGDKRTRFKLTDDVFSTSERLVLDLNEIQLKIGYCGNYHIEERNQDRYIGERLIEGKNTKPLHFSLRSTMKNGVMLDERFIKVEKEPYKGKVMCVEVENHNWYVMCNWKTHWTGNCNHPTDSTIDLGRISHNITELHWEQNTLVGEMELNISEGFRKNGICSSLGDTVALLLLNGMKIGVSSRAVGSVEQRLGQTIVGDDLELICWDVVSDPSTPLAYISNDRAEIETYIESDETKKGKSKLDEKLSRVENLLKE